MSVDVLPDCRTRERKGIVPSALGNQCPIFCANCGKFGGYCPEKMTTYAFYMCQPCADSGLGDLAHFYQEPDHVFWKRVQEAQMEEHKRVLSADELIVQLDDPTTTLAKLADEWRTYVRKEI